MRQLVEQTSVSSLDLIRRPPHDLRHLLASIHVDHTMLETIKVTLVIFNHIYEADMSCNRSYPREHANHP